jgi:LysR family transcriptional regulator, benzoate and cis,cis-muconate-responsive activator of ben and cat genes
MSGPPVVLPEGVEFRLLEVFVAVAEELHFGRAAERLGIAQPPVSRSIQMLESRLGLSLMRRSSRTVALTRAGEVLLRSSRELLRRHRELLVEMSSVGPDCGTEPVLSVAVDSGLAGDLVTDTLPAFAVRFPRSHVDLRWVSHGADGVTLSREADLAVVCADVAGDRRIDRFVVCSEKVGAVVGAGHPAARAASLTLSELSREPQLRALHGSEHWVASLSVGGLTGLPVDWAPAGYDTFEDGLDLVATGRGVMLASRLAWEGSQRDDLRWIPVPDAGNVALMVAWRSGGRSARARVFAKLLVEGARLRRVNADAAADSSSGASPGHHLSAASSRP